MIRVLVVDDSALIRQMLTRALSADPRIDIVGTAKTGVEAIEKARDLSPDVITLDIEMPELSGLEALPHIRKFSDARVVMLSSLDDPDTTYRALSLGAVDFLTKPGAGMASSLTELTEVLLKKIKTAQRVSPDRAAAAIADELPERLAMQDVSARTNSKLAACVAIAASTGGPPALERVFAGMQASLPAAFVVVQHLPQGFAESLARRLSAVGDVRVVCASEGDLIQPGYGYLAAHGRHMEVRHEGGAPRLIFTDEPARHGVRPAADPLFESVAEEFGSASIGVVLTGMGADGAKGACAIRRAGGDVIAQDEATSVVWGMPGAAVRLDAAQRVTPIGLVAAEVRRSIRARAERASS